MSDELRLALEHHQRGDLHQAVTIYQQILAQNPQHADAMQLLGVAALQLGQAEKAHQLIQQAIALNPGVATYHCNLGEVCRALGRWSEAEHCFREALQLQPDYAEALNNLGLALSAQNRHLEAADYLRRALELLPNLAQAHNNLGVILKELEEIDQAKDCFRRALELDERYVDAHCNLSQLLLESQEETEALTHAQRAMELNPNNAVAHNVLGNVLREIGQREEATQHYREAVRLNPNLVMAYCNLAETLVELGQYRGALTFYQQGLAVDAKSVRILCGLATLHRLQENYEESHRLLQQALQIDSTALAVYNALGQLHLEEDRHEEAIACFEQGLNLSPTTARTRCHLGFAHAERGEESAALSCFEQVIRDAPDQSDGYVGLALLLKERFPEETLAAALQLLSSERLSPNAEATLRFALADVLDAQDRLSSAGDQLKRANQIVLQHRKNQGRIYDPTAHEQFLDQMIETFDADFFERCKAWGIETSVPVFHLGLPRSGKSLLEHILSGHPEIFGAGELKLGIRSLEVVDREWNEEIAKQVAEQHLSQLTQLAPEASRIIDTMPDNYQWLGLLAILFPNCTIVHCQRDLRDVAVACWKKNFKKLDWTWDFGHIASRIREYRRIMNHWQSVIPDRIVTVQYEELIAHPEEVVRSLLDRMGLEWDEGCFAKRESSVNLTRETLELPLTPEHTQQWKRYASHVQPLIDEIAHLESADQ